MQASVHDSRIQRWNVINRGDLRLGNKRDGECARVVEPVKKADSKCFGGESEFNTLTIITKLEKLYQLELSVRSDFKEQNGKAK
jgi:hypothetical protein